MTRGERDIVQEAGDHVGRVASFIRSQRQRSAGVSDGFYPEPETVTQSKPQEEQCEPDSEP
jgi:hypothetical protein